MKRNLPTINDPHAYVNSLHCIACKRLYARNWHKMKYQLDDAMREKEKRRARQYHRSHRDAILRRQKGYNRRYYSARTELLILRQRKRYEAIPVINEYHVFVNGYHCRDCYRRGKNSNLRRMKLKLFILLGMKCSIARCKVNDV